MRYFNSVSDFSSSFGRPLHMQKCIYPQIKNWFNSFSSTSDRSLCVSVWHVMKWTNECCSVCGRFNDIVQKQSKLWWKREKIAKSFLRSQIAIRLNGHCIQHLVATCNFIRRLTEEKNGYRIHMVQSPNRVLNYDMLAFTCWDAIQHQAPLAMFSLLSLVFRYMSDAVESI